MIVLVSGFDCSLYKNMGSTYDLSGLVRSPDEPSYTVTDGDLPCTTVVICSFKSRIH